MTVGGFGVNDMSNFKSHIFKRIGKDKYNFNTAEIATGWIDVHGRHEDEPQLTLVVL